MRANLQLVRNPEVQSVFNRYPDHVRKKIEALRQLIFDTAEGIEEISSIEETLKWGEPSYLTVHGSTVRIDWKSRNPEQYAMYFKCTSKLVPTFRAVFGDRLKFEDNRAIVFELDEELPEMILKKCITAALMYHKVKHLPELGIEH